MTSMAFRYGGLGTGKTNPFAFGIGIGFDDWVFLSVFEQLELLLHVFCSGYFVCSLRLVV